LRDEEIIILNGVLELNTKEVERIMTPLRDVVVLSADDILDEPAVNAILQSGYSRFPVHEPGKPTSFIGLLLIKKLLTYDPSKALPVSSFPLSILPEAHPSINCFQALDYFQTGRAHLILVSVTPGKPGGAIGIITLEDIIEEIISEEIVDETDQFEDNRTKVLASRCANSTMMKGIVEPRRPGSFFIDTSLLGRIHSIHETYVADGRTTTTTTTTTTNSTITYRDNPSLNNLNLNDSPVDLTMSKLNDGLHNGSRRIMR